MEKEMIEFLYKSQIPLYNEEKILIKEFIETFFDQYQPERSKREDFYGMKASLDSNGILTMETGEQYDLNQPIEDAVL